MGKGKVFIAWTEDNSLALSVKQKLKIIGFDGIVGGKNDNNNVAHSVGQTIIEQMNECSSAIILFKGKSLSSNMLYELGYLSGTIKSNRILTVYIDVSNDIIPSDLLGIWALKVDSLNLTDEELAEIIVTKFNEEQTVGDNTDCLDLISDYSELKYRIINHKTPEFYNDEIAKIILLFSHSAYIYNDFDNVAIILNKAQNDYNDSMEISLAINCAQNYFAIHKNIEKNNFGTAIIRKSEYDMIKYNYLEYLDVIDEIIDGLSEFKLVFKMMCFNYMDFANVLYFFGLNNKNDDPEFNEFKDYCYEECNKYCDMLVNMNEKAYSNFVSLIRAYINRSQALFFKDYDMEKCNEYFEKSIIERKKLYIKYRFNQSINKIFTSQMEMEYYLALSDNIGMISDESVKQKRIAEIKKFLKKENQALFSRMYNIDLIKSSIEKCE